MTIETELVQACRFLDVICNELHSLNKNIEKYLDSIAPPSITIVPPEVVLDFDTDSIRTEDLSLTRCMACLEEIVSSQEYHHCKHLTHCLPCGPCMECSNGAQST